MSSSTFSALHVDGYVYASPSKSIARDDLSDSDDDTALMDAYNQAVERYRETHDPNGAVAGATALSSASDSSSSRYVILPSLVTSATARSLLLKDRCDF